MTKQYLEEFQTITGRLEQLRLKRDRAIDASTATDAEFDRFDRGIAKGLARHEELRPLIGIDVRSVG